MSTAVFPTLPGINFSTYKRPTFSTRVSQRNSGRTVRAPNYFYPLYEFELDFEFLRSAAAYQELQTLMGFYLQRQGQYDSFLFLDPTDYQVTSQVIGVGDGVTTSFPLIRNMGGWIEPIGYVANQPTVTVAGAVASPTTWGISLPNSLVFATAPANGAQIAVENLEFYFVCRFLDDKHEYENFMDQLWLNKTVKFVSVKP